MSRDNVRQSLGGILCAGAIITALSATMSAQIPAIPPSPGAKIYYVDCSQTVASPRTSLHSLAEVNELHLHPGDTVLFKRATTCSGMLHPQGSGREHAPIHFAAYGDGALPQIKATPADDASLQLFNQEFWEIDSLDLKGGRTYGIFISGDVGTLHHIYLRDLRVHDVRGQLRRKESGLVVIGPEKHANFEDVQLDGVLASSTTQWSGIYISGATHVRILNSIVHDVQGDGIVAFSAHDALIANSVAWHTGMQHQLSIGTPNAIWTWDCTDCTVEDNEAFLTDSPGVDGGAFDIDYGNTRNTVRRNFGHDTAGYCISVFGALGPTSNSVVADNLCLSNGLSPRLAQRQGALLLMTWQGGSIDGLDIHGNRIDWQPSGNTPAIQIGTGLQAQRVSLNENEVQSSAPTFVNSAMKYSGEHNHFEIADATDNVFDMKTSRTQGWQLVAKIPSSMPQDKLRATLVSLKSAALQFGHAGLQLSLSCDGDATTLANDLALGADGTTLAARNDIADFSLALISPEKKIVREWHENPGPVELGLALRQTVGPPVFGYLDIEKVLATD